MTEITLRMLHDFINEARRRGENHITVTPEQARDIMSFDQFLDVVNYNEDGRREISDGEIGMLFGMRIVVNFEDTAVGTSSAISIPILASSQTTAIFTIKRKKKIDLDRKIGE